MARGRPTEYREAYVNGALKLAALGATDAEVADFFGIDVRTLYRWKNAHEDFCQALKAGKEQADDRVERALFHRAVGYEQEAVKIFMPAGADAPIYAPFVERIAPDTTAAIFWLKNRRPEEWREKAVHEHSGPNGAPIQHEVTADAAFAQLASLLGGAATGPQGSDSQADVVAKDGAA